MPKGHKHRTVPFPVMVDVDRGIVDFLIELQRYLGLRTLASCQGGDGERGWVRVTWDSQNTLEQIRSIYDMTFLAGTDDWAYVHPPRKFGKDFTL